MSLNRQLVIFDADSTRPSINDLSGMLVGNGQAGRMGGTARVSVLVDAAWRVHALAGEFAIRGLTISWDATADGKFWVRTSYSARLLRVESPSFLDGVRLRLWFIAGGALIDDAAVLQLSREPEEALTALSTLGLEAEAIPGPAIRIAGSANLARLAELIGEPPPTAPAASWPPRFVPSTVAMTQPPKASRSSAAHTTRFANEPLFGDLADRHQG